MMEQMMGWKRDKMCGAVSKEDIGKEITLMGWADTRRNLGSLVFIFLRDREGIVQCTFDKNTYERDFEKVESIRTEYVLAIRGTVCARDPKNINPNMKTGEIEVRATDLKILSKAETTPFYIQDGINTKEELRLKYRYLDLRRPELQKNIMLRHRVAQIVRSYLSENGFLEIETPVLVKSTPEGARDYLVPSRVQSGKFYALPQSPQIYKQLLMVSGFDRYFQIVKCFRDEDLRFDRQPEFTQIDMELSFAEPETVMEVNEGLIQHIFGEIWGKELSTPFRRMPYREAMDRFGSDKPDTRFGLELKDITEIAKDCGFGVFQGAVQAGGSVRGINAAGLAKEISRKQMDALTEYVKTYGAKGLAWMVVEEEGVRSPIAKFFSEKEIAAILQRMEAKAGDILFFVSDAKQSVVYASLGHLRLHLAEKYALIDEDQLDILWVTEFPQFEYDEDAGRYVAMHHPFTAPMDEDIPYLESDPGRVRAKAYDIVINGMEAGGGSVRIHSTELQEQMFRALGFTQEQAWERFGFLMEAFQYGTPPHAGLAYGMDRLCMILSKAQSIRDVIAFPKVQTAACLMSGAPDYVEEKQLEELHIQTVVKHERDEQ